MTRAPFLSSMISPLVAGTLLGVSITGHFLFVNFTVVLLMGIFLHIATNVYNDIYDTLQGTDKINVHRNEFSGGSGVLIDNPELMPTMARIARLSLLFALAAAVVLFFLVDRNLRPILIGLFVLSAFFSKFYTAAPFKLAYRGLGELSVWFAFGPMAILVAAVSQNIGFHPAVIAAMPISGISTLSILLIGQIIDVDADREAGKWGVAVRLGVKKTSWIYLFIQLFLCANVIVLALFFVDKGWPMLLALIPYLRLLPKSAKRLLRDETDTESHKTAAGLNVSLHLQYALLFSAGLLISLFL